ncbi:flavin reductase domain protein FMN-binding protein [Crinalium epipsammum PCC 9333]|uniref:Flavin reductase domain protein FMN-binding protein n=1 Tax=Crinalium epipsammum PCC 9333 TaxID=1173022 RepID=K9VY22_9CYAN|nr:diflavin flavoprotein [Crinalium epipsammum]AFZ12871.1 flavin reductase domain protein FMN-binding protein [Crinalium epipsammum PCC 9333]
MTPTRDVQVLPIATDTTVLRSRTWERLKFEIEYALKRGTTANSFIIQAEKTALIDPPGESFTEIFMQALKQRFDLKKLDYVILGHVNPNRSVTLKTLLELAPQITFVCSNPGAIALRAALPDNDLNILVMRGEETLDLGKGHHLEFIPTPSPRWADSLCTYDRQTEILYTDKLFGAHICGDQVFDEGWTTFNEDRRYYFDCLMAPHARQVETALDKLSEFQTRLYAPGHGALVRYGLLPLTQAYREWIGQQQSKDLSVALIYASAYGNTATLASAIARGITKAGVAVESINCEFTEPAELQAAVEKANGFIIGSPTLGGHAPTPVQTALGIVLSSADKTKYAGVFGSYGWSGEAIDLLEGKLKDAGYQFGFDPIRVKFKPTDATLKYCEEAGTDFAQALKKAKKARIPRQQTSDSQTARIEQAVGRVVGSMCVVTTKQEELSGAMLASWVSQASFNPPGFTVAIAKERAIESLTHTGKKFVLNILAQGNHLGLMKHFLKPFAPGEDRFVGVATEEANNGCPILTDALAYLECTVSNRMECGDHWLVYAAVENGKLLQTSGVTAVHHRKSGSHY